MNGWHRTFWEHRRSKEESREGVLLLKEKIKRLWPAMRFFRDGFTADLVSCALDVVNAVELVHEEELLLARAELLQACVLCFDINWHR